MADTMTRMRVASLLELITQTGVRADSVNWTRWRPAGSNTRRSSGINVARDELSLETRAECDTRGQQSD
jgi:hypothetical protein